MSLPRHLWKQSTMADVEIIICVQSPAAPVAGWPASGSTVLQQLPGHSHILSLSPYLAAQVQQDAQEDHDARLSRTSSISSGSTTCSTCSFDTDDTCQQAKRLCRTKQVHITLPDASYQPAALAVLAGLYAVKPWSQLLADLTRQQQVQAAVLAGMWQLPDATRAAVGVLRAAIVAADQQQRCSDNSAAAAAHVRSTSNLMTGTV